MRTGVPPDGDRAVTSYAMLRTTFMRSFCVLALALAACSSDGGDDGEEPVDCATVTGVDTYNTDLHHAGGSGVFDFKMISADPAPPARGNNTWVVQVTMVTPVVGTPVDGATFKVTPFMPAHQHGTGVPVEITPMTDGTYQLSPVNLWMQGVWETTIRATSSDGTSTDSAVFKFCVD